MFKNQSRADAFVECKKPKPDSSLKPKNIHQTFLALFFLTALSPANAAIKDWVGGGTDGNIGTAGNWSPGGPGSGDIARWNSVAFTRQMNVNGNWGMGELYFAATQNNPVTFGTGTSQLQVYGVSGVGIQMDANSAAVNTGSAKFRLYGNQSWINNSANTLTEGGTIDSNTGGYTLTNDGTGSIVINGWIANGSGTTAVVKNGSGSLTLTGSGSTFTGGLTLNAGTLNINNAGALGGGSVTLSGGTLDNTSAGNITISTANTYYFGTNFAWGSTKALTLGAANTVNLTTHCTLSITNNPGNWLYLNGPVNGNYSLTLIGPGAVVMSGAGNYTGGTVQKGSGYLILRADNPLGTGTLSISNNATIEADWINPRMLTNSVVLAAGQTLGNASQNGLLTFSGPMQLGAAQRTLTINSPIMFSGPVGGGGITKVGSSTLTLSAMNTYSGATTVTAGEWIGVTGGSCSNSAVTVAAGATNGVQVLAVNGRWASGALTYGVGATFLDFNLGGILPSTTTAPLLVNGNLNLTGTTLNIIVRSSTVISTGVYPLIQYTGTLAGTPPTTALALPAGWSGIISNDTANSTIDLLVTNYANPNPTVSIMLTGGTNVVVGKNLFGVNLSANTPNPYSGSSPVYTSFGVGNPTNYWTVNRTFLPQYFPTSLTDMGVAQMRYPGGHETSFWHWDDNWWIGFWDLYATYNKTALTNRTNRKIQYAENMDIDEYMANCTVLGTEPLIGCDLLSGQVWGSYTTNFSPSVYTNLPYGGNPVRETLAMLSYLKTNCPAKPVSYVFLDNEVGHGTADGSTNADNVSYAAYPQMVQDCSLAFKSNSPNVKIVVNLIDAPSSANVRNLVTAKGQYIDYVDSHFYYVTSNIWQQYFRSAWMKETADTLGGYPAQIRQFYANCQTAGYTNIKLASLEWNLLSVGPASTNSSGQPIYGANDYDQMLVMADMLMMFVRERVEMACVWPLYWPSANYSIIDADANYNVRSPFYTMKLFKEIQGQPTQNLTASTTDMIALSALQNVQSTTGAVPNLVFILLSKSTNATRTVTLNLGNFSAQSVSGFSYLETTNGGFQQQTLAPVLLNGNVVVNCAGLSLTKINVALTSTNNLSLPATGTNITFSVTGGNTLNLGWPTSYIGWQLWSNSVGLASSNSWFQVPGATSTNSVYLPINPTQPQVFYRLQHP